ncbi:MAG TPA: hypothetical protein VIV11_03975 [Kofleriaceae bacterium]
MKRDATNVIWRTVVFAGAMLGSPACSKKQPQTTPQPPATQTTEPAPPATTTDATQPPTPDPATEDCRVRGCDNDGGGGMGRGFVLS